MPDEWQSLRRQVTRSSTARSTMVTEEASLLQAPWPQEDEWKEKQGNQTVFTGRTLLPDLSLNIAHTMTWNNAFQDKRSYKIDIKWKKLRIKRIILSGFSMTAHLTAIVWHQSWYLLPSSSHSTEFLPLYTVKALLGLLLAPAELTLLTVRNTF